MAFLDLNNVRKSFAQSTAVENFNLQVERGEFISFLGPSGCGKTTTLRMVAGCGHDQDQRRRCHQHAAKPAPGRHGVPILRAVSEHDRR
jgi:ABC-type nitrate/sulfonate/bicarbonate transport system ATPase subunit